MPKNDIEQLNRQIELLVHQFLDGQRAAVIAAVERAFSSKPAGDSRPRKAKPRGSWGPRRMSTEVAELTERVYGAVRKNPGAPLAVLTVELGESRRALQWPLRHLRLTGRVRSVGEGPTTRYFPMTPS